MWRVLHASSATSLTAPAPLLSPRGGATPDCGALKANHPSCPRRRRSRCQTDTRASPKTPAASGHYTKIAATYPPPFDPGLYSPIRPRRIRCRERPAAGGQPRGLGGRSPWAWDSRGMAPAAAGFVDRLFGNLGAAGREASHNISTGCFASRGPYLSLAPGGTSPMDDAARPIFGGHRRKPRDRRHFLTLRRHVAALFL